MDTDNPIEATRITFTIKGCIARSTFLAGFTYYELGRNDYQQHSDTAYVVLLTAGFCFSVLSVGLGTVTLFYLERCQSNAQKIAFVDRANDVYVRWTFRLFLLALLVYILGIGRIGFVYFDESSMRYVVLSVSSLAVPIIFYGLVRIVRAQLSLQRNRGAPELEMLDRETQSALVEVAKTDVANSTIQFHELLMSQADTVAQRAIYLTGFCQSGIVRYIQPSADDGTVLGYVYLISVAIAFAAAAFPAFLFSIESIFIHDTQVSSQASIAALLKPLHDVLSFSYFVAFLAMGVALTLMGYGCKFKQDEWVPMCCGIAAVVFLAAGIVVAFRLKREVISVTTNVPSLERKEEAGGNTADSDSKFVLATLSLINNTGSQATISSGFVFYNVVTYGTDIVGIATTGHALKVAFLGLSSLTLAAGLVSSIYDSILSLCITELTLTQQAKFLRGSSGMISVCIYTFQVSIVCFLVGFGLFGNVKFQQESFVPLGCAIGAIVCIILGWIFVNFCRKRANEAVEAQATCTVAPALGKIDIEDSEVGTSNDESSKNKINSRLERQKMMASRALFFGGFSYFALCFFSQQSRGVVEDMYPVLMSLSFSLSMVVVVWSGVYQIAEKECTTVYAKIKLLEFTQPMFRIHVIFCLLPMITFTSAFAMIGWIKSIDTYADYAPVMLSGTSLLVFLFMSGLVRICRSVQKNVFGGSETATPADVDTDAVRDHAQQADAAHKRFVGQVQLTASQAAFIAGNVFYEILFAQAYADPFYNYVYYVSATITFVSGVAVVGTATLVEYLNGKLNNNHQRRHFIVQLKQLQVKRLMFTLNSICIFSWLCSLSVFGLVKYKVLHQLWQPPFAFSMFGLVILLLSFVKLHLISNSVMGKDGGPLAPLQ